MPPLGPTPQADVTTPEKEEQLMGPLRMPGDEPPTMSHVRTAPNATDIRDPKKLL